METIPVLSSLTNDQFDSLLSICIKQEIQAYSVIYREGEPSNDMFILTEGSLKVTLNKKDLGRIHAISTVGEMGLFTKEPRSATIITFTDCTFLKILKTDLFNLFEKDKDFHIKFQAGMLLDVSKKMRTSNELISKLLS